MSKLTEIVATTLEYHLNDLSTNRTGKLALTQLQRLQQLRQQRLLQGGITIAIFIAISLGPLLFASITIPSLIFSSVIGLIGLWIASRITTRLMQIQRDISVGIVEQVAGIVTLTTQTSTSSSSRRLRGGYRTKRKVRYGLEVDGEVFTLTQSTYEAFWDGKSYTIFYVPYSREIVGAETLEVSDS